MKKAYRDICAERDGIEVEVLRYPNGRLKGKRYKVKCAECGEDIRVGMYESGKKYLCDYCKRVKRNREQAIEHELESILCMKTKKQKSFDKAVKEIRGQVRNFKPYEKAVEVAYTSAELYGSIPEAMVAIELLRLGYRVIAQQPIGRYRVDFLLPDNKIVIEVDGELFHNHQRRSGDREAIISLTLGLDWDIIHIPAELIRKNIRKLNDCIKLYENRREY